MPKQRDYPNKLVYHFLDAWWKSMTYQEKIILALADTLQVLPTEIFYSWNIPPRFKATGTIADTQWRYFFHGIYNCALMHLSDRRFLQISFGPRGRFDVFSGWSTLQFIMASKKPWPEFSELKEYLAKKPPPYDHLSGSHAKMSSLMKQIARLDIFEMAAPDLCALKEKHTTVDEEGRAVTRLPEEFNDFTKHNFWDIMVCNALVLNEKGQKMFSES